MGVRMIKLSKESIEEVEKWIQETEEWFEHKVINTAFNIENSTDDKRKKIEKLTSETNNTKVVLQVMKSLLKNTKEKITFSRIMEGRKAMMKKRYNATDIIFAYPKDDELVIGNRVIKCMKDQIDTGTTIFGMKIWVDETLKDNCFYIINKKGGLNEF